MIKKFSIGLVLFLFFTVCNGNCDEYVPIFDTSDSYLSLPMSQETARKINDMKKSFGDDEAVSVKKRDLTSHITSIEQYFSVNVDGSIDYKEKGSFYIIKKFGDDGILFDRILPIKSFLDKEITYENLKIDVSGAATATVKKRNTETLITFKGDKIEYEKDTGISGRYEVSALIKGMIDNNNDVGHIYFNIQPFSFSVPVDKLFIGVVFSKMETQIFGAEAFLTTDEGNINVDTKITDGRVGFRTEKYNSKDMALTAKIDFENDFPIKNKADTESNIKKATVDFRLAKNTPQKENKEEFYIEVIQRNILVLSGILFTLCMFLYYLFMWIFFGRVGKIKILSPAFRLPENISIAKATIINRGRAYSSKECLALSLINLVTDGFLTIEYNKNEGRVIFIRTDKNIKECKNSEEKILLKGFFKEYEAVEFPSDYVEDVTFQSYYRMLKKYKKSLIYGNLWVGRLGILLMLFLAGITVITTQSPLYAAILITCFVWILFMRKWFFVFKKNGCSFSFKLFLSIFLLVVLASLSIGGIPFIFVKENQNIICPIVSALMIFISGIHLFFTTIMDRPKKTAMEVSAVLQSFKIYMSVHREKVGVSVYKRYLPFCLLFGCENKIEMPEAVPDFFESGSYFDGNSLKEIVNLICK